MHLCPDEIIAAGGILAFVPYCARRGWNFVCRCFGKTSK